MSAEDSPVSVLIVSPRFRPDLGGVETVVERTAEELTAEGVDVTVLTCGRRGARRESIAAAGGSYQVRRARLLRGQSYEFPLQLLVPAFVEARRHDVLHVHSYHALAALVAALAAGRRPIVFTPHYHGTGHTGLRSLLHRIYRPFGRLLIRRAALVYANSEAEASLLRRDHGDLLDGKLRVLWPGVSIPERQNSQTPHRSRPQVLSVSRLEDYKRIDLLVKATLHQEQVAPNDAWDLAIVGDGPARERLEALAQGSPRVTFLGRLSDEDLARCWYDSDLFASASEQESFGLGVAQAVASGLRCVASAIPTHREIVETAKVGRIVSSDTPEAWCAAIGAALATVPTAVPIPGWGHVAERFATAYRELRVSP